MPIFLVRVSNQNVKEYAVNCPSQDDARMIVLQAAAHPNSGAVEANPNVVLLGDNTSANTDVSQAEASADWSVYTNKRLK